MKKLTILLIICTFIFCGCGEQTEPPQTPAVDSGMLYQLDEDTRYVFSPLILSKDNRLIGTVDNTLSYPVYIDRYGSYIKAKRTGLRQYDEATGLKCAGLEFEDGIIRYIPDYTVNDGYHALDLFYQVPREKHDFEKFYFCGAVSEKELLTTVIGIYAMTDGTPEEVHYDFYDSYWGVAETADEILYRNDDEILDFLLTTEDFENCVKVVASFGKKAIYNPLKKTYIFVLENGPATRVYLSETTGRFLTDRYGMTFLDGNVFTDYIFDTANGSIEKLSVSQPRWPSIPAAPVYKEIRLAENTGIRAEQAEKYYSATGYKLGKITNVFRKDNNTVPVYRIECDDGDILIKKDNNIGLSINGFTDIFNRPGGYYETDQWLMVFADNFRGDDRYTDYKFLVAFSAEPENAAAVADFVNRQSKTLIKNLTADKDCKIVTPLQAVKYVSGTMEDTGGRITGELYGPAVYESESYRITAYNINFNSLYKTGAKRYNALFDSLPEETITLYAPKSEKTLSGYFKPYFSFEVTVENKATGATSKIQLLPDGQIITE